MKEVRTTFVFVDPNRRSVTYQSTEDERVGVSREEGVYVVCLSRRLPNHQSAMVWNVVREIEYPMVTLQEVVKEYL